MSGWDSDYRYEPSPLFQQVFLCLPFDRYKSPRPESGNKIIMPESTLSQLLHRRVRSPFFFKIEGFNSDKTSHCGVLEFGADEGIIHMPRWMMRSLCIYEGDPVVLRDAALSRGTYMKLQPHAAAFMELSNVKAVLEKALRGFSCLSSGETIVVRCNQKDFYLDVLEVRPGREAISLIDTDCVTDFAPPLDYDAEEREDAVMNVRKPFYGAARRSDGDAVMVETSECSSAPAAEMKEKREKGAGREFKPSTGMSRVDTFISIFIVLHLFYFLFQQI